MPNITLVLAAHLTGARNVHRQSGSFSGASLHHVLDDWIGMSPGLCQKGIQVHVVHDAVGTGPHMSMHRGIVLHRFPPDPTYLGGDRRWSLYAKVLQTLQSSSGHLWHCAWALDLDVAAISIPHCNTMPKMKLHIGSDACSRCAMAIEGAASSLRNDRGRTCRAATPN